MESIIHHEVKIPSEEDIVACVCRFCMISCEEYEALRIPWNDWQHSLLAAMYERIMNQELFISKHCSEFCCNKCSQLLSQTVATLDMFERSDTMWRGILNTKTAISPKTESIEFSDDNQSADQSRQQKSILIEIEFMKIESGVDFQSEFGELDTNTANDDEPVMVDSFPEIPELLTSNRKVKATKCSGIKRIRKPNGLFGTDNPFPCSVCNKIFRTRLLLTRHMSKTHSIKLCPRCKFTSPDSMTLQRHYVTEHKRKISIDTISACAECGKAYSNTLSLKEHMKRVHCPNVPSQCHICSKIFRNQRRLQMHTVTHAEPTFQCDMCSKMFRLKKHIIWHIKNTHSKTKNFICSMCGKDYTEISALKLHERTHCPELKNKGDRKPRSSKGRKVSCGLCSQTFSALTIARRHYREEHHIVDMSVICMICNHFASSRDDLRIHQNEMHLELRCSICMRFCVSDFSLQLHIATHSKRERLFKCSICHATFLKLPDLNLHTTRVHTNERPFKCTDCDLRFVSKFEMTGHWRHKHEHIRKYQCQWCDKSYAATAELRAHETNHTGIGHKRCKLCSAHFRQLYQLTKHMNTFHPEWKMEQNCTELESADCLA